MDLAQRKLSQEEWESLEVPITGNELRILKMIRDGYNNVNITSNDTQTLLNFIKIEAKDLTPYHHYLYETYFKKHIDKMQKDYNLKIPNTKKKKMKNLKKADMIRIKNTDKKLESLKNNIFEYILLDITERFLGSSSSKKNKYYYTLVHLMKYHIANINTILYTTIEHILKIGSSGV